MADEELKDDLTEDQVEAEEQAETPEAPDPEAEAEARKYGWRDKSEFTLAPDGWVDATRFLELPSTQLKMTRDLKRELERELKSRNEKDAKLERTAQIALEKVRQQERERYEQQLREIEAQKRAAVEMADTEAFDRAERARQGLKAPETIEPAPRQEQVPEYIAKAEWLKDPHAYQFAFNAIESNPVIQGLPPERQIAWAAAEAKKFFPELFSADQEQPQQQRSARVDSGGLGFRPRTKGADDLPQDVRKVGEMYVNEGIYKSISEYAEDYFKQG